MRRLPDLPRQPGIAEQYGKDRQGKQNVTQQGAERAVQPVVVMVSPRMMMGLHLIGRGRGGPGMAVLVPALHHAGMVHVGHGGCGLCNRCGSDINAR